MDSLHSNCTLCLTYPASRLSQILRAMDTFLKWLNLPAPPVNNETKPKDMRNLWSRKFKSTSCKSSSRRPGTPLHGSKAGNRAQTEDAPDQSCNLGRFGSTNLLIPTSRPSGMPKAGTITTTKDSGQTRRSTHSEPLGQLNCNHEQAAVDMSEHGRCESRTRSAIAGRSRSTSESMRQSPSFASATGRSQSLRTKIDAVPQNPCFRPLADIGAPDNSRSAHIICIARLTHVVKGLPMRSDKPVLNQTATEYISNTTAGPQLQRSRTARSSQTDLIMRSKQRSNSTVPRGLKTEKSSKRSESAMKRENITRPNGKLDLKPGPSVAPKSSDGITTFIDQSGVKQESSQSCLFMLSSQDEEVQTSINKIPPELPPRKTIPDTTVDAEPPEITSTKTWDSATTVQDFIRDSRASTITVMEDSYLPELDEEWFDPSFVQQVVQDSVKNEPGELDWRNAPRHEKNARYIGKFIVHIPNRHRYDRPPGKRRQSAVYEKRSGRRCVAYGERLTCKW